MASSKKQTTFAKLQREQRVKERRALKLEKKQAAKAAKAAGLAPPSGDVDDVAATAGDEAAPTAGDDADSGAEPAA